VHIFEKKFVVIIAALTLWGHFSLGAAPFNFTQSKCEHSLKIITDNPINSGQSPLTKSIFEMGAPSLSNPSKATRVQGASDVLKQLGGPSNLVNELAILEDKLFALSTQTMSRAPHDEEIEILEGRGLYQTITINDREATVYTKGTGNASALNCGPFPCFPNQTEKSNLFYDEPGSLARHPRIVGTETVTWGLLELINATVIFHHAIKEFNIKTLDDAIRLGVTIPIQVNHFPELTTYINELIDETLLSTKNEFEIQAMDYKGNRLGLGAVQLIVPATQRNIRNQLGMTPEEFMEHSFQPWKDPKSVERIGRTLRILLEAGFVYSDRSAHGQNMYRMGNLAQADNSDLIFLGDLKAKTVHEQQVSVADQGQLAMAKQILFSRGLFPPTHSSSKSPVQWKGILQAQEVFWNELLIFTIPDANKRKKIVSMIPKLLVVHPTAASLALGQLLFNKSEEVHSMSLNRVLLITQCMKF